MSLSPLAAELDRDLAPEALFARLAGLPHCVFFDSATRTGGLARYSYLGVDPCQWLTIPADGSPALTELRRLASFVTAERVPGLPPWQGGVAGMIGYEIGRSLERLPTARWDEFCMPALAVGLYDCVVAFDHREGRAWAISQGLPDSDPAKRKARAEARLEWLMGVIEQGPQAIPTDSLDPLPRESLAPSYETPGHECLLSGFTESGYLAAVENTIELLRAGEAYQVNLSQRILAPDPGDPIATYLRLRERNSAPFGAYLDGGPWQLLSASPERFLQADAGLVETRPIKGTRPRGGMAEEDELIGQELRASEKDQAENVMIVDLLRNDLARVCEDFSVEVPELFRLERYARVQHLVSVVRGRLRRDSSVIDLLAATLPGGSVTGAPKVRAQEIIATLEPTARGAYCGAMFWIGLPDSEGRQSMDSSVLIRTITRSRGWLQLPAGGGVVVQSDPRQEYEETWHKAAGLIEAIRT